jgi:Fe2+ transport system protein B
MDFNRILKIKKKSEDIQKNKEKDKKDEQSITNSCEVIIETPKRRIRKKEKENENEIDYLLLYPSVDLILTFLKLLFSLMVRVGKTELMTKIFQDFIVVYFCA